MLSQQHKDIVKLLRTASSGRTLEEAFRAMVCLGFCSWAKNASPDAKYRDVLEEEYMREVARWPDKDVRDVFPAAIALVAVLYADPTQCNDHLGIIAGELGTLSSDMGQFFTPIEVCRLMAKTTWPGIPEGRKFLRVSEPAAGGGAMILALADHVKDEGHDPTYAMWVEASELNYTTYQICFLALNFSGIAAVVRHTNTLSGEVYAQAITMGAHRFVERNGSPWTSVKPVARVRKRKPAARIRTRSKT